MAELAFSIGTCLAAGGTPHIFLRVVRDPESLPWFGRLGYAMGSYALPITVAVLLLLQLPVVWSALRTRDPDSSLRIGVALGLAQVAVTGVLGIWVALSLIAVLHG